jgi:hypothetical protein
MQMLRLNAAPLVQQLQQWLFCHKEVLAQGSISNPKARQVKEMKAMTRKLKILIQMLPTHQNSRKSNAEPTDLREEVSNTLLAVLRSLRHPQALLLLLNQQKGEVEGEELRRKSLKK